VLDPLLHNWLTLSCTGSCCLCADSSTQQQCMVASIRGGRHATIQARLCNKNPETQQSTAMLKASSGQSQRQHNTKNPNAATFTAMHVISMYQ
jgi:hypothetical protein